MPVRRIVANKTALDALDTTAMTGYLIMRTAPDELMVLPPGEPLVSGDAHAIQIVDTNWFGAWLEEEQMLTFLSQQCEWAPPSDRPAFAQGAVAHVPVKLWFELGKILILTAGPYLADLQERMAH
jgi:hypothetical protein